MLQSLRALSHGERAFLRSLAQRTFVPVDRCNNDELYRLYHMGLVIIVPGQPGQPRDPWIVTCSNRGEWIADKIGGDT